LEASLGSGSDFVGSRGVQIGERHFLRPRKVLRTPFETFQTALGDGWTPFESSRTLFEISRTPFGRSRTALELPDAVWALPDTVWSFRNP
jgi:hypothetical protein